VIFFFFFFFFFSDIPRALKVFDSVDALTVAENA